MIDVELRLAVDDLYANYAACLDEARYADWIELFTEDCRYELVPRENHDAGLPLATIALESKGMLKDRVYGITQTLFHAPYYQRHIISGIRVLSSDADRVQVQTNYLVLRTRTHEVSEVFNTGRYIDSIQRTPEGLRFAHKRCVFDSELVLNSIIYPV